MRIEWIGDCQLIIADVREGLRSLREKSVQTVVTSPPYWGLRDYGVAGQIGLEATPGEYVATMVDVFREVRRVLADDGTLWLNLGDSYAGSGKGPSNLPGTDRTHRNMSRIEGAPSHWIGTPAGIKPKDLVGIPWRVAFALQADGWYLRQDIIWSKSNPMPESVKDRCTKAHEYLFLLSKSPRYYFDQEAISEPSVTADRPEGLTWQERKARGEPLRHGINGAASVRAGIGDFGRAEMRNKRSVWEVTTQPYSAAHFATYPPKLIEPCILAGSLPSDTVLDPFGGSGTTAGVALDHGRKAILIELSEEYAKLVPDRIRSITDSLDQQRLAFGDGR